MPCLSFHHFSLSCRRLVASCAALAVIGVLSFGGGGADAAELVATRDVMLTQIDSINLAPSTSAVELVVDTATQRAYYIDDRRTNDLFVYDVSGSTLKPITSVALGRQPVDLALNTVTHDISVVDVTDNTLTVVDGDPASPTVNTVTATIATGGTEGIAVAVDYLAGTAGVAYVANRASSNVSVIDIATQVGVLAAVGSARSTPTDVTVDPTTHTAFVADWFRNTITTITGYTPTGTKTLPDMPTTLEFAGGRLLVGVQYPPATPTEFRIDAYDATLTRTTSSEDLGGTVRKIAYDEGLAMVYASTDNHDGDLVGLRSPDLVLESRASLVGAPATFGTVDPGTHRVFTSASSRLGATLSAFSVQASPIVQPGTVSGVTGTPFRYFVSTIAAPAANDFSIIGTLPPGLTLNRTTGEISGTPTAPGTSSFTVQAANGFRMPGAGIVQITITGEAPVSPSFTSGTPVNGTVGTPYRFTVTASGYPAPTFSLNRGTLPAGLSLDSATGVISGTPTTRGTSAVSITASNSSGDITAEYSIVIAAADPTPTPTPAVTAAPQPTVGSAGGSAGRGGGNSGSRLANTGFPVEPIAAAAVIALVLGGGTLATTFATGKRRGARG